MQNEELRRAQVELDATRARYFDLYDLAPVGYVTVSEKGLILEANLTAARLLGVERSTLVKRRLTSFILPQDEDIYYLQRKKLLETGLPQVCEVRMVRPDSAPFWARIESGKTAGAEGAQVFRVVISDITERKRAEQEREVTIEFLRLVNRSTGTQEILHAVTTFFQEQSGCEAVGIRVREGDDYPYFETRGFPQEFVLAENKLCAREDSGEIVRDFSGNPVLECMCGNVIGGRFDPSKPFFTTRGSFWTNSTTELLAATSEAGRQSRTRNRCNGEGYESVALIPLRVGEERFGLLQLNDGRKGQFSPASIALWERLADQLAIALEKFRTEMALRESEERFRQVVESAPVGMLIWSDGVFRYLNPAALAMFGAETAGQLIGQAVVERIHPDSRAAVAERMRVVKQEHRAIPFLEERYLRLDGTTFYVEVTAIPFTFEGRDGAISFVRDITERKRAEEEKTQLQNQFLQAQKLESVGQLAGGVAHDFNNLLQVINGYGDLLLRKLMKDDPLREQVAEIRRAGEQGAVLTKQLLTFSREQIIEPEQVDLNQVIQESQTMLQRLVGEDVEVETSLSLGLGRVMSDRGRLHQVLMNLAANSRDAMPRGGKFTIRTANIDIRAAETARSLGLAPGRFVLLQVSDTGTGIPKEIQERVFDPFFTTKDRGKGTGLGLATVYGIVRLSRGAISAHSESGHGTTFDILLPRVEASVPDAAGENASPESLRGIETVLVVEDRPEVRKLAVSALQDSGYQVLEAAEGSMALQVAEEHSGPIHLLLTDVIMPHMTGKELAERLKPLRPEIKVLYMSGYAADVISSRGSLNADEWYIAKPFSLDALLAKVQEVLNHPGFGFDPTS
jgi:PAS domain S-box-containing protein